MDGKNRRPFRLPSKFKKRARCCIAEEAVTMAIRGEGGCGVASRAILRASAKEGLASPR